MDDCQSDDSFEEHVCKPPKEMSNTAFVRQVMEFSKAGPLAQLVVVESIMHYTSQIVSQQLPEEEGASLISARAWQDACKIVLKEFEVKYGSR
jgi:hypothetical protein